MTKDEARKLALEALENSIDLVSNEAREAEKMYANVPTRLARVQGLVALEVAHEKAITALRETQAEPTSGDYAFGYAEGFNDACKPAQRQARSADTWVVPDFLTAHDPETLEYRNGWNDYRQVMMEILRKESK